VKDLSGDEEDGYDETICPSDYLQTGMILDDDLYNIMIRPLPKGVTFFSLMDCCHSGTGMDLPYVVYVKDKASKKLEKKKKDKKKKKKSEKEEHHAPNAGGLALMVSGCRDHETSADVMVEGLGATGAMSFAFISIMGASKLSITYEELLVEMRKALLARKSSIVQVPQLSTNEADFDLSKEFRI